jgi:hypothetical protein
VGEKIDARIVTAIEASVRAGVFWAAARLNPNGAAVWERFAVEESQQSTAALRRFAGELGR